MSPSFADAAWPACLSSLRLDRWLAGELPAEDAEEVRAHVAGCPRCTAAADALRSAADVVLPPLRSGAAPRPVPGPLRPPGGARRLRPATLAAVAGALAVASGVLVAIRTGGPAERTKGPGVALAAYVQHGDAVRRAADGDVLAPGDAVRFAVSTPAPAYVAVLSVDAAGHASVYFPAGPRAERVEAGADVPLPLAARLDGTVGRERVIALFCEDAVLLEPVRAGLEAGGELGLPEGCRVTGWHFEKR